MTTRDILAATAKLYRWSESRNFEGHEPHDLLESPAFRGVKFPALRLALVQLGRRSPLDLHSLFRVPTTFNPKAGALFLEGLLRAGESATKDWQQDAGSLAERLILAQRPDGGWAYPFAWQSRTHFVAADTSNVVTTAFAASALAKWNERMPDERYDRALLQAAQYVLKVLPRTSSAEGIAFGYAEHSPQIVFNASLLAADLLSTCGAHFRNTEMLEIAQSAAEFVAAHQRSNGSWIYGLEASQTWIDSFHTGFVVVSLKRISEVMHNRRLLDAANKGFEYYRDHFIDPLGRVKYYHNRLYPIDAHALGQAMVTLSCFGDHAALERVAEWSVHNMLDADGYSYYQLHPKYTNKIPYMRWSNAWMFRGLAELAP